MRGDSELAALVLLPVFLVIAAVGAVSVYNTHEDLATRQPIDAVVSAIRHGQAHIEVTFSTPRGEDISLPVSTLGWVHHEKGDHVVMLYRPEDPRDAELDQLDAIYCGSLLTLGLGGLGSLGLIGRLLLGRRLKT